jgi:hypothetical protein
MSGRAEMGQNGGVRLPRRTKPKRHLQEGGACPANVQQGLPGRAALVQRVIRQIADSLSR